MADIGFLSILARLTCCSPLIILVPAVTLSTFPGAYCLFGEGEDGLFPTLNIRLLCRVGMPRVVQIGPRQNDIDTLTFSLGLLQRTVNCLTVDGAAVVGRVDREPAALFAAHVHLGTLAEVAIFERD